jgi:hypothetical protein
MVMTGAVFLNNLAESSVHFQSPPCKGGFREIKLNLLTCFYRSLKSPLAPLGKGGTGFEVPLTKGDLGG